MVPIHPRWGLMLLMAANLTACGGGGGSSAIAPPTPASRGDLLVSPPLKLTTLEPTALLAVLNGSEAGRLLLQLVQAPLCSVNVHQLQYRTVEPSGALTPASGVLMVPGGSDPACSGGRPVLLYAHGTSSDRGFNIADIAGGANAEGALLAAVFAASGFIVVAPNYVGYDSSTLGYHPYLVADQQSKDMIDALAAARRALPVSSAASTSDGGKLFVTGYSQGGYVAMATHKALQQAGASVTASAPMSGPYALSAFGDALFQGQVSEGAVVNLTLLTNSYQRAYSNLYSQPAELFESAYAAGIADLLPSTTPVGDLQAQGKLPAAVFSPSPPDARFAAFTPALAPANLSAVFAQGFAPEHLVSNAYRLGYLLDAQAAPDGGFPDLNDGLPPANPANALRQNLKLNDLRNWTPAAPVLLCGGNADPTVYFFNTLLMQQYWTVSPPADIPVVLDVDSAPGGSDPYASIKIGFQAAKAAVRTQAVAGGATDGGARAVLDAYHAGLVPPFCLGATLSFFNSK